MTQGGIQAYGTSARSAPELETPPLLHYILSLTQEGQLHAPSIFFSLIKIFNKTLAHLGVCGCARFISRSGLFMPRGIFCMHFLFV